MQQVAVELPNRIVVTGGAGFIGSALIRHLLAASEARVVNVDKLTYASNPASIPQADDNSRYTLQQADIADAMALRRTFDEVQPEAVLNLAAESHVDRSIDGPAVFIQSNLVGTFTLLQEAFRYWRGLDAVARRKFRFLHVSTDEVFGSVETADPSCEGAPYAPNSPYAATKAGSDHLVRAWWMTYGLPVLVTNCSNNYGPYQFPEKLIPHMIIRGVADLSLPVYGDGLNVRDWLHVEDHVRALLLVLTSGRVGESYNISGRSERTNLTVVEAICDLLDAQRRSTQGSRRSLITFVPDRPGHDRRYALDSSKIEHELGWAPRETFESGLATTVRWYLENSGWWQQILQRGYKPERVGVADG